MSGRFDGKVALVTGGASGIGLAAVRRLVADGAAVAVADRDAERIDAALDEIKGEVGAGASLLALPGDVTDPSTPAALVAATVDAFGRLDIAVNNAGTSGTYASLPDQTLDDWSAVLAVNLTSVFLGMQAQIPAMIASGDGGSVVNVASDAGLMGFARLPAYVASKHGVVGLTKAIALEYARKKVRVNAVCPGSIRTPMLAAFTGGDQAALESMGTMSPIGRLGEPEEIAAAISWLCSDDAVFVTGTALPVDGGVMAT